MTKAVNTENFTMLALSVACLVAASPVLANECARIADNESRLACYDSLFGSAAATEGSSLQADGEESRQQASLRAGEAPEPADETSRMIEDWDLAPEGGGRAFAVSPYKPVYILLATHTSGINAQPRSDNAANSVSTPIGGLSTNESQFQLSFKTKVWSNVLGSDGNLWVGYTQSSRWQIYSGQISRPFRETNYEPEALLMFRTPFSLGNWNLRMSGIGLNHQSNGRSNPISRSWNRIVGVLGIENGDLSVQVRPWVRLRESAANDNNPGIENYVGRGEVIVAQRFGGHIVALTGRHSLRTGGDSRGSVKLDWAIPISGNFRGHLTLFSGYGESMVDYNHRQTMLGAGVSLVEW